MTTCRDPKNKCGSIIRLLNDTYLTKTPLLDTKLKKLTPGEIMLKNIHEYMKRLYTPDPKIKSIKIRYTEFFNNDETFKEKLKTTIKGIYKID